MPFSHTLTFRLIPSMLLLWYSSNALYAQTEQARLQIEQIKSNSLFQSLQQIHILSLKDTWEKDFSVGFFQPEQGKLKTSEMALSKEAVAGINGSFFNINTGKSVVYLETQGIPIAETANGALDFLHNGVILITNSGEIHIGQAQLDFFYQKSKEEAFVLVSGPLLLKEGVAETLENHSFVTKRHPRTCVCQTDSELKFIVVDGRSEIAHGMSLTELQQFLITLGCVDALNLDGGGSSTLWSGKKGIVNTPSDKEGERPVSSTILIFKR